MFGKKKFYTGKKGNGYAIGHVDQRGALGKNRYYLMPIFWDNNDIWVAKNEIFYTVANASQMRGRTFLTQKGMKYMGAYWINNLSYQNELIFYPYPYYDSFGQMGYPVINFECKSPKIKKYSEWLGTDDRIFMKPYIKKY